MNRLLHAGIVGALLVGAPVSVTASQTPTVSTSAGYQVVNLINNTSYDLQKLGDGSQDLYVGTLPDMSLTDRVSASVKSKSGVALTAYSAPASPNFAYSSSQISYGVNINGPDPYKTVLIDYNANLFSQAHSSLLTGDNVAIGGSGLTISAIGSYVVDESAYTCRSACEYSGSISKMLHGSFLASGSFSVNEYAFAEAANVGSAFASADPFFFIDPGFVASNPGYSLEFSSNVGNMSGTPEPAAWALMLLGFGTAGTVMRRRNVLVKI
jgi:hypothetical protein